MRTTWTVHHWLDNCKLFALDLTVASWPAPLPLAHDRIPSRMRLSMLALKSGALRWAVGAYSWFTSSSYPSGIGRSTAGSPCCTPAGDPTSFGGPAELLRCAVTRWGATLPASPRGLLANAVGCRTGLGEGTVTGFCMASWSSSMRLVTHGLSETLSKARACKSTSFKNQLQSQLLRASPEAASMQVWDSKGNETG